MRRHVSIVATVAVGVFSLAGCGVSRHLAANPTGNGTVRVSHIVPRNGLKLPRSTTPSSTGSTTVTTTTHGHSTGTLKVTIVHSAVAAGADGGVIHFTILAIRPYRSADGPPSSVLRPPGTNLILPFAVIRPCLGPTLGTVSRTYPQLP
ncbi:hypothetical protein [Sulfobacillus sp. hq2]|uniref:hypothetical protein n=1 Tax=Sulfobacillus TaxID=28033 RepID=UPI001FA916D9|nr:hypothetical protein [Sulfobacillus sp. hq2]